MNWRVTGLSVRGTSHARAALPCQDAVAWSLPKPGLLLAVASDGAGSAKHAEKGALLACNTALQLLSERCERGFSAEETENVFRCILGETRDAVCLAAAEESCEPRDFACTLMMALITPDRVAALQIGDGAILARSGEAFSTITKPAESEYLNETVFLTVENAASQARFSIGEGSYNGLVLFTDGLQMLALQFPEAHPHQPFFNPLVRFLHAEPDDAVRQEQFEKFLTSPRITARSDDDLTLLLGVLIQE